MTDQIRKLISEANKFAGRSLTPPEHDCWKDIKAALEQLLAENDELDGLNYMQAGRIAEMEARIEKLEAVVDAAKKVQLGYDDDSDCPFCAFDALQEALAALNELPIHL